MPETWRMLNGTLVIRDEYCYLIEGGHLEREIPLFLYTQSSGAGWFEGFTSATTYFRRVLHKHANDQVTFQGIHYSDCGEVILVRDHRLDSAGR